MAVLKGNVLGDISGKLGKLAARIIRGRTILAKRPTSFAVNNSPEMVEIRNKFSVTTKFVKGLITLPHQYSVWKRVKDPQLSVSNYAFKMNFAASDADKPSLDNIISPPDGFALPVDTITFATDKVTVVISPMGNDAGYFDEAVEADYVLEGLLCYHDPIDNDNKPYEIVPIVAPLHALDLVNPNTVHINLNTIQQDIAAKYQKSMSFIAIATRNNQRKVIHYSATYSQNNV